MAEHKYLLELGALPDLDDSSEEEDGDEEVSRLALCLGVLRGLARRVAIVPLIEANPSPTRPPSFAVAALSPSQPSQPHTPPSAPPPPPPSNASCKVPGSLLRPVAVLLAGCRVRVGPAMLLRSVRRRCLSPAAATRGAGVVAPPHR